MKVCRMVALGASVLLQMFVHAQPQAVVWQGSGPRCAASPGTAQNRAQSQPDQSSGQAEYDRVCKVCHGAEARGDNAPRLVPFSRGYEELLGIVREGSGQMPPISARQLSDESVAEIAEYLRALSKRSAC